MNQFQLMIKEWARGMIITAKCDFTQIQFASIYMISETTVEGGLSAFYGVATGIHCGWKDLLSLSL